MEMSDEMYLLPHITYNRLLFTHYSSLITHYCPFKFDVASIGQGAEASVRLFATAFGFGFG